MSAEECDPFLTSFFFEEDPVTNWRERLREATTVEEFEVVKSDIVFDHGISPYYFIRHPVILRCYLTAFPCKEGLFFHLFHKYASVFRADMLSVVLDFITLQRIEQMNRQKFSYAVDNSIRDGYVDMTSCFLRHGLDPNFILWDRSLLTSACTWGKVDIVDTLLDHGAIVNTGEHLPPIFAAIFSKDINIFDRLIVRGADLTCKVASFPCEPGRQGYTLWKFLSMCSFPGVVFYQRLADMRLPIVDKGIVELFERDSWETTREEKDAVIRILRAAGAS